ncbi:MAG: type II secretion system protein [Phycisphaerales bacterium]
MIATSPLIRPRLRTGGRRAHGFTLIELLVAISIIALLIGIMIPSLKKVRDTSFRVACSSNIRQIGLGTAMFADDNNGLLPASVFVEAPSGEGDVPIETTRIRIGEDSPFLSRALRNASRSVVSPAAVWDGIGRLHRLDYLDARGVYYCPAHTGDKTKPVQLEAWDTPNATVFSNFQYRAKGPDGTRRLWDIIPRQAMIISDSLRPEDELNHRDGANTLRADLASLWFSDGNNELVELSRTGQTGAAWRLLDGFGTPDSAPDAH